MKTVLILLTCLSLTSGTVENNWLRQEVKALVRADPALTVETCTAKCGAIFGLDDPGDDLRMDQLCAEQCAIILAPTTANTRHTAHHHTHHHHRSTTFAVPAMKTSTVAA